MLMLTNTASGMVAPPYATAATVPPPFGAVPAVTPQIRGYGNTQMPFQ